MIMTPAPFTWFPRMENVKFRGSILLVTMMGVKTRGNQVKIFLSQSISGTLALFLNSEDRLISSNQMIAEIFKDGCSTPPRR